MGMKKLIKSECLTAIINCDKVYTLVQIGQRAVYVEIDKADILQRISIGVNHDEEILCIVDSPKDHETYSLVYIG